MKISDIRSRYDIETLVGQAGCRLHGTGRNKWGICPFPFHIHSTSPTPSFSVYWNGNTQRFKCHGQCGASGDVIDFIGFMNIPGYSNSDWNMKKEAAGLLTNGEFQVMPPVPPPPIPMLPQWKWQEFLPLHENVAKYCYSRGLTDQGILKFKLGSASFITEEGEVRKGNDNLLSIPTFHGGALVGIKLRKLNGSGKYRYFSFPGSQKGLFNYDAVNLKMEPVLLLKGEIASMVADQYGLLSCAPTGGEASMIDSIKGALMLSNVVVIGDNDKVPKTNKEMKEAAQRRAALFNGTLHFPPEKYKDWDEWVLAEPDALEITREWMKSAREN